MSMIEILIAAASGGAFSSYIASKNLKQMEKEVEKTKKMIKENNPNRGSHQGNPRQISGETVHRLDLLEEVAVMQEEIGMSTTSMAVKVVTIKEAIIYHFHYLHRPQPQLTLIYNKESEKVTMEYIQETLLNDKKRLKEIIRMLSDKIIEKHQPKQVEKTIESPLREASNDVVFLKAQQLLQLVEEYKTDLALDEVDRIKENIANVVNSYFQLKEYTRKQCAEEVLEAMKSIEDRFLLLEAKKEEEKVEKLKQEIIENLTGPFGENHRA